MVWPMRKIFPLLALFIIHFSNDVFAQSNTVLKLEDEGTDKIIDEGANLILICAGDENAIFYYPNENSKENVLQVKTKNGIQPGVNFTRTSVTAQDTGYYGCVHDASEVKKNKFPPINPWIYVYVKSNKILIADRNYMWIEAYKNHKIVMPCRPTSPKYNYYLHKVASANWDYQKALDSGKLVFDPMKGFIMTNLEMKDRGAYDCKISNEENSFSQSRRITLSIHSVPQLELTTTETEVIQGQDFQIQCTIDVPTDCTFKLQWLKPDGTPYPDSSEGGRITTKSSKNEELGQEKISLTIKNIRVSDQGKYACQVVSDELRIEPKAYYVHVTKPPTLEISPTTELALQGQDFQIQCMIEVSPDYDFKLEWLKPDGTPYPDSSEGGRITTNSSRNEKLGLKIISLTVKHITVSDEGKYTCQVVSNKLSIEPKAYYVHVTVPKLEITSTPQFATRGEDIQLDCTIYQPFDSHFKLYWTTPDGTSYDHTLKDGRVSSSIENGTPLKRISLKITNIELRDQGSYVCQFSSDRGVKLAAIHNANVYDPPQSEILMPKCAVLGQDFKFGCHLDALDSYHFQHYWKTPQNEIINENSPNSARITSFTEKTPTKWPEINETNFLMIKKVTPSDEGNYICVFSSTTEPNVQLTKQQYIKVHEAKDIELSLTYEGEDGNVTVNAGGRVVLSAMINAFPRLRNELKIEWLKHTFYGWKSVEKEAIVQTTGNRTKLIIREIQSSDKYAVQVSNGCNEKSLFFKVDAYRKKK